MKVKLFLLFILLIFSLLSLKMSEEIKNKHKKNNNKNKEILDVIFTKVILNNQDITTSTILFFIDKIDNTTNLIYEVSNNSDKDINIEIKCNNTKQFNKYYTFTNEYNNKLLKHTQLNGILAFNCTDNTINIKDMFMCKINYFKE